MTSNTPKKKFFTRRAKREKKSGGMSEKIHALAAQEIKPKPNGLKIGRKKIERKLI